jgi:hypothetical protein
MIAKYKKLAFVKAGHRQIEADAAGIGIQASSISVRYRYQTGVRTVQHAGI